MSNHPFIAPSIETMNGLLPAFEFVSLIMSNADQAVYVANQKSLDRHVAIKVHSPEASSDEDFKEAFEVMARQMAKLNHINLIGVYNSGIVEGMLYLAMEFVPGKPLHDLMKGAAMDPARVSGLIDGICSGLARAHQDGIVHGGLCPLNVLVTAEYEPKIGNFGFASTTTSDGEDVSSRYLAPELSAGEDGPSALADVYSLGVLLYELYTSKPFAVGVVPAQLATIPGRKVLEIIKQATAAHPMQRYASVEEFRLACMGVLPKGKSSAAKLKVASASAAQSPRAARPAVGAQVAASGPPPQLASGAHRLRMLTHFLIIAILCYAIYVVWNRLEQKKAAEQEADRKHQLEEQQRAQELKAQQAAEREAQRKRLEELQKRIDENRPPEPEVQPEIRVTDVKPPSPLEALDKLRGKLLAGDRSKMPEGAQQSGQSHYLLIDEAMSWPEASWFAESYGAHLAMPAGDASVDWLRGQFGARAGGPMWIGAAKSGADWWMQADGSLWKPDAMPAADSGFVALGVDGKVEAHGLQARYPFVIQWRADGSNPAALAGLLRRTQTSAASSGPVIYPPGTVAFGIRHYLYVAQPLDWRGAAELARSGGGHLLVISGVAEAFNIEKWITGLPAANGIWIGGFCKSGKWAWITGESWDSSRWRGGQVPALPNAALSLTPPVGWVERAPDAKASGFIIEWSSDASSSAK